LHRSSKPFAGIRVTGAGVFDGLNVLQGASWTTP
jgi:hypothetical protein